MTGAAGADAANMASPSSATSINAAIQRVPTLPARPNTARLTNTDAASSTQHDGSTCPSAPSRANVRPPRGQRGPRGGEHGGPARPTWRRPCGGRIPPPTRPSRTDLAARGLDPTARFRWQDRQPFAPADSTVRGGLVTVMTAAVLIASRCRRSWRGLRRLWCWSDPASLAACPARLATDRSGAAFTCASQTGSASGQYIQPGSLLTRRWSASRSPPPR